MNSYKCKACGENILIDVSESIPDNKVCPECNLLWSAGFKTAYFGTQEDLNKRLKRKDKLKKFKI